MLSADLDARSHSTESGLAQSQSRCDPGPGPRRIARGSALFARQHPVFLRMELGRGRKRVQAGIELNPAFATAHTAYATNYLNPMGRLDEAIAEIKVALELEPLSLITHATLAGTLHHARRFDEAI